MVAQSLAKNFGLYGERVGCLTIPTKDVKKVNEIENNLTYKTRNMISNCPRIGSDLVKIIL